MKLCNQGHGVFPKKKKNEAPRDSTLKMIKHTRGGFRGCVHLVRGKIQTAHNLDKNTCELRNTNKSGN